MKSKTRLALTPVLEKILLAYADIKHLPIEEKYIKKLAQNVQKISNQYVFTDCSIEKDTTQLYHTYLNYYLPVNLVKLYPVLDELVDYQGSKLFESRSFHLLDIGSGPGTFTLGFLEYLAKNLSSLRSKPENFNLWGIDREQKNLSIAKRIIKDYITAHPFKKAFHWNVTFKHATLSNATLIQNIVPEKTAFDLIIAGNIVTELNDTTFAALAKSLEKHLAPFGALIIIDPGTRTAFRNLLKFRDAILKETALHLYAPCLNAAACPLAKQNNLWCHEKVFWDPPAMVKDIDVYTGFTKYKGLKYSYFTFMKKKASFLDAYPDISPKRAWRVTSYLMKNKGLQRLIACNGVQRITLRRLSRNASDKNADFIKAKRGDIIMFENCVNRDGFTDITRESFFTIVA